MDVLYNKDGWGCHGCLVWYSLFCQRWPLMVDVGDTALFQPDDDRRCQFLSTSILQPFSSRPLKMPYTYFIRGGFIASFLNWRNFLLNTKQWITKNNLISIQARIAQLVAYRLGGTSEVPGSNPGKDENFSVKICNWIVRIWIQI